MKTLFNIAVSTLVPVMVLVVPVTRVSASEYDHDNYNHEDVRYDSNNHYEYVMKMMDEKKRDMDHRIEMLKSRMNAFHMFGSQYSDDTKRSWYDHDDTDYDKDRDYREDKHDKDYDTKRNYDRDHDKDDRDMTHYDKGRDYDKDHYEDGYDNKDNEYSKKDSDQSYTDSDNHGGYGGRDYGNSESNTSFDFDNRVAVVQQNRSDVQNDVTIVQSTGGNTIEDTVNKDGGSTIVTGDATASLTITNLSNLNILHLPEWLMNPIHHSLMALLH